MDEADQAEAAAATYLAAALRNAAQPPARLPALGRCCNCDEDLTGSDNLRSCDDACMVDYTARMATTRKLAGMPAKPTLLLRDEGAE